MTSLCLRLYGSLGNNLRSLHGNPAAHAQRVIIISMRERSSGSKQFPYYVNMAHAHKASDGYKHFRD